MKISVYPLGNGEIDLQLEVENGCKPNEGLEAQLTYFGSRGNEVGKSKVVRMFADVLIQGARPIDDKRARLILAAGLHGVQNNWKLYVRTISK